MRHIIGITGCKIGRGPDEIESKDEISVRVVDCADQLIALRIGTHSESVRMTPEEARHVACLLNDAADRAETRAPQSQG